MEMFSDFIVGGLKWVWRGGWAVALGSILLSAWPSHRSNQPVPVLVQNNSIVSEEFHDKQTDTLSFLDPCIRERDFLNPRLSIPNPPEARFDSSLAYRNFETYRTDLPPFFFVPYSCHFPFSSCLLYSTTASLLFFCLSSHLFVLCNPVIHCCSSFFMYTKRLRLLDCYNIYRSLLIPQIFVRHIIFTGLDLAYCRSFSVHNLPVIIIIVMLVLQHCVDGLPSPVHFVVFHCSPLLILLPAD